MKDIYTITKGCYRHFAEQIAQRVGSRCYLSGVFYSGTEEECHRLEVNLLIYRDLYNGQIVDISPVWWDSYTIVKDENGEIVLKINDFDFNKLRRELC